MDHQIKCAVLRTVNLDKMIAASQGADAAHGLFEMNMLRAFQRLIRKIRSAPMRGTADRHTAWNLFPDYRIQLLVFYLSGI